MRNKLTLFSLLINALVEDRGNANSSIWSSYTEGSNMRNSSPQEKWHQSSSILRMNAWVLCQIKHGNLFLIILLKFLKINNIFQRMEFWFDYKCSDVVFFFFYIMVVLFFLLREYRSIPLRTLWKNAPLLQPQSCSFLSEQKEDLLDFYRI